MTILNATPDSFSDGGELSTADRMVNAAQQAETDGADMLDIGGESTRPGADRIDAEEQIRRVVPAIRAIRDARITLPISVDTTLSRVAEAALDAGADAINDVSGATEDHTMLPLAAERRCGLILMHRLRPPGADRYSDRYAATDRPEYPGGVVGAVRAALQERLDAAAGGGIDAASVVLDPGLGFGKTVEQNLELIRGTPDLLELGRPILGGASRKSFVGRLAAGQDRDPPPPAERDTASIVFTIAHLRAGARLFRVHATRAHAEALRCAARLGF